MGEGNDMKESWKLSKISEISDITGNVEQALAAGGTDPALYRLCTLICEELLVYLLRTGYPEVTVCVRKGSRPVVDVEARGEKDPFYRFDADTEQGQIEAEINRGILDQYSFYTDYGYRRGVNCYRIDPERSNGRDLRKEIYSYYENADEKAEKNHLGILLYLFRNHRLFIILSILNRTVKHTAALLLAVYASNIIDAVAASGAFFVKPVLFNIIGAALTLTLNLVCAWLDLIFYQRFVREAESGFKMSIVQKLQTLSMKYHMDTSSGKLLSKLVSDVQFIKMLMHEQMQDVLHLCIDLVFVIVVSLRKMPVMLLFFAVMVPLDIFVLRRFMKPIQQGKVTLRHKTEDSNAAFKEMLEMDNLTRSHGLQKTEYQNISAKVRDVQSAAVLYDRYQLHLNSAVYGMAQGFKLLCLCCAAYLASKGKITIGSVVLFLSIFDTIVNSIQKVMDQMPQIMQGYDSLVSVDEILLEKDVEVNGTQHLPEPVRGEVVFQDVVFRYRPERPPVLNGVNLRVPAGKSAAFIGRSGVGKSTILSLVLGLYSQTGGSITVDGVEINELDKNSYRQHIAVVPQSSVLFSGTLWDNLVYGLKYVTTARVMEVLRSVGLESLVERHPDGLNRPVYEGGVNLSGGQRQRIAIARALLREPKIILFDEATSALDPASEKEVQAAIDAIMGTCTVLMVAHRLNTIRKADLIYRIEDGKAVLCESFEQVMQDFGTEE